MTKFVIQVWGDPLRPTLFFSFTGNKEELEKATRFDTAAVAERYRALCGTYEDRGWTSKVVEVQP